MRRWDLVVLTLLLAACAHNGAADLPSHSIPTSAPIAADVDVLPITEQEAEPPQVTASRIPRGEAEKGKESSQAVTVITRDEITDSGAGDVNALLRRRLSTVPGTRWTH